MTLARPQIREDHLRPAAKSQPLEGQSFLNSQAGRSESSDTRGSELVYFFVHEPSVKAGCDRRGQRRRLRAELPQVMIRVPVGPDHPFLVCHGPKERMAQRRR